MTATPAITYAIARWHREGSQNLHLAMTRDGVVYAFEAPRGRQADHYVENATDLVLCPLDPHMDYWSVVLWLQQRHEGMLQTIAAGFLRESTNAERRHALHAWLDFAQTVAQAFRAGEIDCWEDTVAADVQLALPLAA